MLPAVAVAVDAQRRQRPEGVERLSDSSDHLFADARILLGQRLGYKSAVDDLPSRLLAESARRATPARCANRDVAPTACTRASVRPSKVSVALSSSSGARPAR
jgi:hypothetical protein